MTDLFSYFDFIDKVLIVIRGPRNNPRSPNKKRHTVGPGWRGIQTRRKTGADSLTPDEIGDQWSETNDWASEG